MMKMKQRKKSKIHQTPHTCSVCATIERLQRHKHDQVMFHVFSEVSKSGSPVDVIQQVRGFYRRLHVLKPHRGSFYRHMASYSLRYTDEEETTQNVTLSSTPQFKLSLCPTLNDKIDMFTDSYFKETDYAEMGLKTSLKGLLLQSLTQRHSMQIIPATRTLE